MRRLTFSLFIVSVLFASCMIDFTTEPAKADELPAITQTGANTFGCLVNGKVWLPKGGWMLYPIEKEYNYSNGFFKVDANRSTNEGFTSIGFSMHPVYNDTTILLSTSSGNGQFCRYVDELDYYYPIGQPYTGELNITKLDTTNRIMAGTFWFDAIDTTNNTVVQVRDGRFDLRY